MSIARTILEQLGGNRFVAMTGAKNLVSGANSLQFSIGRGAKHGINKVRVSLAPTDLYIVECFKLRGIDCKEISKTVAVPAESLRAIFTRETGMDCTL